MINHEWGGGGEDNHTPSNGCWGRLLGMVLFVATVIWWVV